MALAESLVLGSVVVTAAGLIGYRILKRRGTQLLLGGGTPESIAAPTKIDAKTVMMILVSMLVLCSWAQAPSSVALVLLFFLYLISLPLLQSKLNSLHDGHT